MTTEELMRAEFEAVFPVSKDLKDGIGLALFEGFKAGYDAAVHAMSANGWKTPSNR